jgi:hypothetical protein
LHQQGQMVDNNFQWWDDRCIQRDPFSFRTIFVLTLSLIYLLLWWCFIFSTIHIQWLVRLGGKKILLGLLWLEYTRRHKILEKFENLE